MSATFKRDARFLERDGTTAESGLLRLRHHLGTLRRPLEGIGLENSASPISMNRNHERTSVVIILDSSRHEVFRTVTRFLLHVRVCRRVAPSNSRAVQKSHPSLLLHLHVIQVLRHPKLVFFQPRLHRLPLLRRLNNLPNPRLPTRTGIANPFTSAFHRYFTVPVPSSNFNSSTGIPVCRKY